MFVRLATALLLVTSAACSMTGPSGGRKAYSAPSMAMPAVRDDIFGAVRDVVRSQQWTIVSAQPELGRIEAVTPAESALGVPMRERWVFTVIDYEVRVARQLEVSWDGNDTWSREDEVCSGYVYLREREVLGHLEKRVAQIGKTKKYAQVGTNSRT